MTPSFVLSLLKNFSVVVSSFFSDWGGEGGEGQFLLHWSRTHISKERISGAGNREMYAQKL